MYRNVLLHQRETSTHKAAKSVGPHGYFQVGFPEFVPNGYMDYSCISLQSKTLAVVVFYVDNLIHERICNDVKRRPCPGGKEGYYYYYYCTSIIIILVLCYRSKLNTDLIFLCWVDFEFPQSPYPNYSWFRARRQWKLTIYLGEKISTWIKFWPVRS